MKKILVIIGVLLILFSLTAIAEEKWKGGPCYDANGACRVANQEIHSAINQQITDEFYETNPSWSTDFTSDPRWQPNNDAWAAADEACDVQYDACLASPPEEDTYEPVEVEELHDDNIVVQLSDEESVACAKYELCVSLLEEFLDECVGDCSIYERPNAQCYEQNPGCTIAAQEIEPEDTDDEEIDEEEDESIPTLQATRDPAFEEIVESLPEDLRDAFEELAMYYREEISISPVGRETTEEDPWLHVLSPGSVNNIFGDDDFACGAYQGNVLDWLEGMRKNPERKELIEKFDFGPVQIAGGAHQAVVVFPKGTDWRKTGVIMDPWKEQRPMFYSLTGTKSGTAWCKLFWLGLGCPANGAVGGIILGDLEANVGYYPTTPNSDGNWAYRGTRTTVKPGSRKKISIGSPVTALLTSEDGKQIGITESGEFVNDFGYEVEAQMTSAPDGTYTTSFNLPEEEYTLEITSSDEGEVHVLTADDEGIKEFDVVEVSDSDSLTLSWEDDLPVLTDQNDQVVNSEDIDDKSSLWAWILGLGLLFGLFMFVLVIILIFGLVYFFIIKKGRK